MSAIPFNEASEARFAETETVATAALPKAGATLATDLTITFNSINVIFTGIPTSDPSAAGALWSNSGVLTVSAG